MSNQTFKVVGITVHGDTAKVRFTDDMVRRIKQFSKGGATRCDFVELDKPMTKVEALNFMLGHETFKSAADQQLINDAIADREKEATKGTVKVKVPKAPKAAKTAKVKPSVEAIKARAKKDKAEVTEVIEAATEPAAV